MVNPTNTLRFHMSRPTRNLSTLTPEEKLFWKELRAELAKTRREKRDRYALERCAKPISTARRRHVLKRTPKARQTTSYRCRHKPATNGRRFATEDTATLRLLC